jgi:hypothetical protein
MMKNLRVSRAIVYLILFLLLLGSALSQETKPGAAGEILSIGCEAYWKKSDKAKEDQLDPQRDKGRKLYPEESVRCVNTGVLKIVVYGRAVDVNQEMGWYPIPENTKGDESETGGRHGEEELSWLTGTYRLNEVESDSAEKRLTAIMDSLRPEERMKYRQFSAFAPAYLALEPNKQTITFASSQTRPSTLTIDGAIREIMLNDYLLKTQATAANQRLNVTWKLDDQFTADLKVQPANQSGKLFFIWTFRGKGNSTPAVIKEVYDRNSGIANLNLIGSGSPASPGEASGNPPRTGLEGEIVIAVLLTPITLTERPYPKNISLLIVEPRSVERATLNGMISIETASREVSPFTFRFNSITLAGGATIPFEGTLAIIFSSDGTPIVRQGDLVREGSNNPRFEWRHARDIPAGSEFIFKPK